MMKNEYYQALEQRRSYYGISAQSPVSDERIIELVQHSVKFTPSAFNSQSARAVVLLGENHKKLWSITLDTLREVVPPEAFAQTEEKVNSFAAGYATVLYFEDTAVTEGLMQAYPLYTANFPVWAQQENGMLQHAVWTSLTLEGLGATLQHYNPLIDGAVRAAFHIPQQWKLVAQMPFGTPTAPPNEKEFMPIEERVTVIK